LAPGTVARRAAAGGDRGPGGFRLGQRVQHAKFGEGTILGFDGDGDRAQIEVRFRDAGVKRLMLGFANLRGM
jgi:DNA helicase-2/ATP-dependent DNA helicase PcrA